MYDDSRQKITEMVARQTKMRAAGKLVAEILDQVAPLVKAGMTTDEINKFCHKKILEAGATPAPLNYKGFPKSICTSVNNIAYHGVPDAEPLKDGDLIKIDVSLCLDGFYGDSCRTYFVGTPSEKAKEITVLAYNAMANGINQVRPGGTFRAVIKAIENTMRDTGYSVTKGAHGHGIGEMLHMRPPLFSDNNDEGSYIMKPGMMFTVEPVIVEGEYHMKPIGDDGSLKECSVDPGKLSAGFEHTVLVTSTGYELLTKSPSEIYLPDVIKDEVVALKGERQR